MPSTATFPVQITFPYAENVIPPRCRKPRAQQFTDTITVEVPVVSAEDAPVVMRVPDNSIFRDKGPAELRGYQGRLFAPKKADQANVDWPVAALVEPGDAKFPAVVDLTREHYGSWDTRAERVEALTATYSDHLIIDGKVWVVTDEPCYAINTFGLGGNHGGTGLFIQRNIPRAVLSVHPATDYDVAVAEAVKTAEGRGDNQSVPGLRATERIVVLDPSYVTVPSREDVLAARELEVAGKASQIVDVLTATTGDVSWSERLRQARDLIDKAQEIAWLLP